MAETRAKRVRIAYALCVIGAITSGLVLLNCFYNYVYFVEKYAGIIYFLTLATLASGTILLLMARRFISAAVASFCLALLLVLSFQPWYVEHWTPWEEESHRHTIWELGHVH
jgi:hypothetical protein